MLSVYLHQSVLLVKACCSGALVKVKDKQTHQSVALIEVTSRPMRFSAIHNLHNEFNEIICTNTIH